jgi:hypothetical protein
VLKGSRATLLEQRDNKNQAINQWSYQTIPCAELVPAAPYECPCIPPTGCMLLRTKYPLPIPITGLDDDLIQSVTSLDGGLRIDKSKFENEKYADGNKFTAKKPSMFLFNNYLYITILKKLSVVQITMLAQDPEQVWDYPSFCVVEGDCEDCCIDIMDREFPLSNNQTETAIQMAANELINIFTQMRKDNNNNAVDDTATVNMIHQPNSPQ